jgi:BA14K-like protein
MAAARHNFSHKDQTFRRCDLGTDPLICSFRLHVQSDARKREMTRRTLNALCAAGLSAAIGTTSTVAQSAPFQPAGPTPQIVLAKYNGDDFRRHGDAAYYHGHKGYRHKRDGYRYYNGFWFPLAAFGLGALIGSTVSRSNTNAHIEWCYDHYRSYRAYDNTYQPYNGPRRQCYSPYG